MSSNSILGDLPTLNLTSYVSNILGTLMWIETLKVMLILITFQPIVLTTVKTLRTLAMNLYEPDSFSVLHSNVRSLSANYKNKGREAPCL